MIEALLSRVNGFQARRSSHILLYHATMRDVPDNLKSDFHNVVPNVLYEQLTWLTKHFDVVDLEEYCRSDDTTGKAAVTFDDAYSSAFSEGLPVLKSLNVPCTVFLCGCTLEGKVFWRDKIRFIINNDLEGEFLEFYHRATGAEIASEGHVFYRYTKTPAVNSKKLDMIIDAFFEGKKIAVEDLQYCVSDAGDLLRSPLVSYGNHTYDHYLLSSLSNEEQEEQIVRNWKLLESIGGKISSVFSIPFGGKDSFNLKTCELLRKYGYDFVLYSRGRLNMPGKRQTANDDAFCLPSFERYMPSGRMKTFQIQLTKIWIKALLA
jgi:peptidoglycan/xylan/chitin deacetylase (PgdA/CDA1 family)